MTKIGIVTIIDYSNYGNRLQNYALQEILKGLGVDTVETIRNTPGPERRALLARRALFALGRDPLGTVGRTVSGRGPLVAGVGSDDQVSPSRTPQLTAFTQGHISLSRSTFEEIDDVGSFAAGFDAFVVGSDQVWNPGFRHVQPIDFLSFARPLQRISYAASFGVPEVPGYLRRTYQRYLHSIPAVSVREYGGAEIVRSLTGRTVPVVLDPTLLLDPALWESMVDPTSRLSSRPYVMSLFLGGTTPQEREQFAALSAADGLDYVDFLGGTHDDGSPEHFLGAIDGATMVLTDSFHAAALSVALHTPFLVRNRHTPDARMSTLYRQIGTSRELVPGEPLIDKLDVPWRRIGSSLDKWRQQSTHFLSTSLDHALSA